MIERRRPTRLPDESLRAGLETAGEDVIIKTTLEFYNTSLHELRHKNRRMSLIVVRHMIHYFLSVNQNRSYEDIAKVFGKDHATVINSRKKIEDWHETDRELKLTVIKIAQLIIRNQMKQQIQLVGQVKNLNPIDAKINFKEAQNHFEASGWEVFNPMEQVPAGSSEEEAMRICIGNLVNKRVTSIALLKNWVNSKGSEVEWMVANAIGLKVIEL